MPRKSLHLRHALTAGRRTSWALARLLAFVVEERVDQADCNRLRRGPRAQLAADLGQMRLDGLLADPHLPRDPLALVPLCEQPQRRQLLRREVVEVALVGARDD